MNLYPLLTGWAVRELEEKIQGMRLESVRTSQGRKTVWLTLVEAGHLAERKKRNLFFSFQPGWQLFFFAPAAEARTHPGWEVFGPDCGGAFAKSIRQKGCDSVVEICFTHRETSFGEDFFLRFILFGKESRVEHIEPPDLEKPKTTWPPASAETASAKVEGFEISLSSVERYLNENQEIPLDDALRKAMRVPGFLSLALLRRAGMEPSSNYAALSNGQKAALRESIQLLFDPRNITPTVIFAKDELKGISPIGLQHTESAREEQFGSFLEALSYSAAWHELKKFAKQLSADRKDLLERKEKIEAELRSFENPEHLRQMGDLILGAKEKIAPRADVLITENWYESPPLEVKIPLDPGKTAKQNAEAYFSKFQKAARAQELLPKRIKETDGELQRVDGFLKQIETDGTVEERWSLALELEKLYPPPAVVRKAKSKERPQIGWTFWTKDGFQIRVGRNSEENDRLTLKEAKRNDLFLHASQSPGSHVILAAEKRPFSKDAILEAAAAAAYFSKARHSTKVNVDYAEVRYVQKPRKAKPGLVVLMRSKSVMVYPKKPERQEETNE